MTICAISTPAGTGGIAVARVSGPDAISIAERIWKGKPLAEAPSHTAHLGSVVDPQNGEILDQAVVTTFRAPHSFTGEDVVEISVHGSRWIQSELINLLIRTGCRLAEPGEFTRRAFTNGRLDLAEAEAVADIIAADSRAANRVAQQQLRGSFSRRLDALRQSLIDLAALLELELDFPEEDVEFADRTRLLEIARATLDTVNGLASSFATGQAIRNGVPVAIVGEPNAGKSSVLNLLVGDDRAIVSNIPGTTRDTVEDTAQIAGMTFRFIDTAGLRQTSDSVEELGIRRTWASLGRARIALWVVDATQLFGDSPRDAAVMQPGGVFTGIPDRQRDFAAQLAQTLPADSQAILLLNKTDLLSSGQIGEIAGAYGKMACFAAIIPFSAKTAAGLDALTCALTDIADPTHAYSTSRCGSDEQPSGLTGRSAGSEDAVIVTNARHYQALLLASESLQRVIGGLGTSLSSDFIAQDVRETIHHLSAITGHITAPDILSAIFSRFCIGK